MGWPRSLSLARSLSPSPSRSLALSRSPSPSRSLALSLSRCRSLALSLSCGWRVEGSGGPVLVVVVVWWRRGSGGGGGGTSVPGRRAGRRRERASAMACGWRGERQLAAARYVATRAASELTNTLSHPVVDWKPASNEWPPLLRRAARFRYRLLSMRVAKSGCDRRTDRRTDGRTFESPSYGNPRHLHFFPSFDLPAAANSRPWRCQAASGGA